jgi:hypothetical protein
MNQGSICTRFAINVSVIGNSNRNRIAATKMENELFLNRELERKAKLRMESR